MNIPFINAILSYLRGDGAVILPEIELVLFGLGILVIDFWIEQKEKYWNAGLDLTVMFRGLETMALSFYVLTGFLRREKRWNEAALKYVLLGAFSSGILAYGFSILYGLSGATNIGAITAALAQRDKFVHVVALSHLPGA